MNMIGPFPLITIGVTCYNAKDTIERALSSALRQTWPHREILVVDDGSSDGSWEFLQKLSTEHPRIRSIRHEANRGFPGALNTLLREARGDFIAFFDDDDVSVPERLELQYKRITEYEVTRTSSAVLCYGGRDVVPHGENASTSQRLGIGRHPPEPFGPIVADYILGLVRKDCRFCWGNFGSGTLMARTTTLRHYAPFDVQFRRCAELDFAVRAAFGGAHFISADTSVITQYLTQTADKAGDTDLRYRLLLLRKHTDYLRAKGAYIGAVANMYAWFHYTQGHHVRGKLWRGVGWALFRIGRFHKAGSVHPF